MISQLQVMDVVVNKAFKDNMRQQYKWLLDEKHSHTPTGKLKTPFVTQLGEWILNAWQSISSETIVKGFKKCCYPLLWMDLKISCGRRVQMKKATQVKTAMMMMVNNFE